MSELENKKEQKGLENSLTSLADGLIAPMINQTLTSQANLRWNLIFNDRRTLAMMYSQYGIIQNFIDVPVDDAFRNGFEIRTDEANQDEIDEVYEYMEENNVIASITQAVKWARLFGGGGLVLMSNQNPETEFKIEKINKFTKIEFYPADLWELNLAYYNQNPHIQVQLPDEHPYNFYGKKLHKSRVIKVKGKEAPSFIRPQMRGWGSTEIERVLRSFNQYIKNNDVIFELLDEAKIDVFKINGLNSALISEDGTNAVRKRIELSNQLKNYLNSIAMDKEDEYEQKQMNFGGLGDMMNQIRINIASDLKIPMTKLFGISSAGFNSGEDDIENYNSMIESEVRHKVKPLLKKVTKICFAIVHGYVPESLQIEFSPLRMLSAEQETNVKNAELMRIIQAKDAGLITPEEAQQAINTKNLLPITIKENGGYQTESDFNEEINSPMSVSTYKKEVGKNLNPKQAGNI